MTLLFHSFGYKHGVLADAGLLYDLRALPNPYWDDALRGLTGRDREVAEFLDSQPLCIRMFDDIRGFLDFWLPHYSGNGRGEGNVGEAGAGQTGGAGAGHAGGAGAGHESKRERLTVGLGCTGGRHRSVYLAEKLFRHYRGRFAEAPSGIAVALKHRELDS